MKYVLLSLMLALSFGCGKKSHSKKTPIQQMFVKGDPLTMVAGTEKNQTSFITLSNANQFQDYALYGLYVFAEKEDMPTEITSIESGQEAETTDETAKERDVYNLKRLTSQEFSLDNTKGTIKFGFVLNDTKLDLTSVTLKRTKYDARIEHYSISPDKTKFSFAFQLETKTDGKVLVTGTFYKNSASSKTIKKVSKDYHYLYGPGVVVPWKLDSTRTISINVCPSMLQHYDFYTVKQSLKAWEESFKYRNQKLVIDVKQPASCKPFSDVNEQAVHYNSSYLTMVDQDAYNPAFTATVADLAIGNIIDSDIIFLGSEIAKDENFDSKKLGRFVTHEMGHFLGLDHQFDGTSSIMSYKSQYHLSWYDMEAIRNLYQ